MCRVPHIPIIGTLRLLLSVWPMKPKLGALADLSLAIIGLDQLTVDALLMGALMQALVGAEANDCGAKSLLTTLLER